MKKNLFFFISVAIFFCSAAKAMDLIDAVKTGNVEVVSNCLKGRIYPNELKDKKGNTPLHWAVAKGYEMICRKLFEGGALVDPINDNGQTPLHIAVDISHLAICRLLLRHGADIMKKNNDQKTPLATAEDYERFFNDIKGFKDFTNVDYKYVARLLRDEASNK